MSLVTEVSALATRVAEQFNGVFTGETITGNLDSAPFGWTSYVEASVTNHPGLGNSLLLTMKNEDDSARVQVSYSITGTYAIRYRLGGSWGSWQFFYSGHEDWSTLTGKPTTFTPATHTHTATDIASGTIDIARIPLGTSSTTVTAGNDSRLSDTRTPADASVTNAKVASGAAIALAKLAAGYVQGARNGVATTTTVDALTEAQFTAIGVKDSNTLYFRTA